MVVRRGLSMPEAAAQYRVTPKMVQYRINVTACTEAGAANAAELDDNPAQHRRTGLERPAARVTSRQVV